MKQVTLQFSTILQLLDFHSLVADEDPEIDNTRLTIKGRLEEADIELAKIYYNAIIIDENESGSW